MTAQRLQQHGHAVCLLPLSPPSPAVHEIFRDLRDVFRRCVLCSGKVDLAAIDPVVATVVSTEYIFQLGFMLVVPVLLVSRETRLKRRNEISSLPVLCHDSST